MNRLLGIGAAVLVLMVGPVRAEPVDPASSPFAAVGKQYIEAFNRKDAAAVAALFTDDAVRVNAQGIVRGREGIQKSLQGTIDAGGHDLNVHYRDTHIDGNTGWSVAEYDLRVRGKDGAVTPTYGIATSVWANSSGVWKIKAQGLTSVPPPR
jgi:uncharacterized protein (TIGR02246 family)